MKLDLRHPVLQLLLVAVLAAAGGRIEQVEGAPFTYGKPDFANPHFAAWGLGA